MNSWELSEKLRWIYQLASVVEPARAKAYVDGAMLANSLETNEVTTQSIEYGKQTGIIFDYVANDALELLRTGQSSTENDYIRRLPKGVVNLLGIDGIKASNARRLYEELGIETVEELKKASQTGRIANHQSFGTRFSDQVGHLATQNLSGRRFVPLPRMMHLTKLVLQTLEQNTDILKPFIVGEVRRGKELTDRMEFLCAVSKPSVALSNSVANKLGVSEIELTKSGVSGILFGMPIKLHFCKPKYVGSALVWSTGPGDFYQRLESLVFKPFKTGAGFLGIIGDEHGFFEKLGLVWIPPEIREWPDVIDLSKPENKWELVEPEDLLGELHSHTNWSDGRSRMGDILHEAERIGLSYLAITDHAEKIGVAKGLTYQAFIKQMDLINRVNSGNNSCRILPGIEFNIDDDGRVDFELRHNVLRLAGLHSGLGQHPAEITNRYVTAVKSGQIDIITHATTRQLQQRPPLELDWEQIFLACANHGVAVEMNYAPDRCDIPWPLGRLADKCGCTFSIGGDLHGATQLSNFRTGAILARRSGLSKQKVLNCYEYDYILGKNWRK